MRIGVFGGTFDPPHVGHLLAASDACDALNLDRVLFVPNAKQPLKVECRQATVEERLEMTRLSVATDARFAVSDVEIRRGGISYSVDTLEAMAVEDPTAERFFLVGADVSRTFAQWKSPRRIGELATIAVLWRSDPEASHVDVLAEVGQVLGAGVAAPQLVNTRRIDVSSTEIRERVRAGRSIAPFVVAPVARLIVERGLYR